MSNKFARLVTTHWALNEDTYVQTHYLLLERKFLIWT